jgi:putative sialic acid transporter
MRTTKLSGWTKDQKSVVLAAWCGWMLDIFDFSLMTFVLRDIAREFSTDIPAVAFGLVLTLAFRPAGAFLFGRAADRYGRRPVLMASVLAFSLLSFASAFATSLAMLMVLRALFGIAMGGEWGVGSSLAMESIPAGSRGVVSGILQTGGPCGYLVASLAYGLLFERVGWRGMFMLGIAPALLALFIRAHAKESPQWQLQRREPNHTAFAWTPYVRLVLYAIAMWVGVALREDASIVAALFIGSPFAAAIFFAARDSRLRIEVFALAVMLAVDSCVATAIFSPLMGAIYTAATVLACILLNTHWRIGIYAVLLMTGLNWFAHGTADLYPTLLQVQRGFPASLVSVLMVIFNIGGIIGSLAFGALSERIGRRRTLVLASVCPFPSFRFCVWAIAHDVGSGRPVDAGGSVRHVGRDSSLSERIVARGVSRDVSRFRLSTRQSARVGECKRAVRICRESWP